MPGIERQEAQLLQKCQCSVFYTIKKVCQVTVEIVVDLHSFAVWRPAEQHPAPAAKDFDVSAEILGEEPVNNIAEGFLAAHPADKAIDIPSPRIIRFADGLKRVCLVRKNRESRLGDTHATIAVGQQGQVLHHLVEPKRLLHRESVPLIRKLAANSLAVCRERELPFAVRDIASFSTGMILICEVADAPVIMGISKPADLQSIMEEVKM